MGVANYWGGVAKSPLSNMTAGAEMAVKVTAAATVGQGQAPLGTAISGVPPMHDENLSGELLRATNHRRQSHGWRLLETLGQINDEQRVNNVLGSLSRAPRSGRN